MKTIILCGGEGTRMKEETEFRPKPLVEVGGKPILWHIMKIYAHYGYSEFILALGYKGDMIKDYFLNWRSHVNDFTLDTQTHNITYHKNGHESFKITFADTGEKSLTGERVRRLKNLINGDDFMVTYGDGVANINIAELLDFHKKQNTLGTITGVNPLARYGTIDHDESTNKVFDFKQNLVGESKDMDNKHDFIINGGFMVFKNEVLNFISENSMIEELFPRLSAMGELSLYKHKGKWKAMDTYK